ncbi:histone deacetylase complex subunit SAP30 [Myotis lucifugus]|uniref:histone deacetylase complex subunit SAP30 n=1 Tax=Myotis lucifugus TaxID=59463 RepID=UPI0006D71CC7|nr:histone deacetylase complex subunit SAP30 [Myotis lucifugus]
MKKIGGGGQNKACESQLVSSSTSGSRRRCEPKNKTPSLQEHAKDFETAFCPGIGEETAPKQAFLSRVNEWNGHSAPVFAAGPPGPAKRQLARVPGSRESGILQGPDAAVGKDPASCPPEYTARGWPSSPCSLQGAGLGDGGGGVSLWAAAPSAVRHLYICDYHKNLIQSVRNRRKRKGSDDDGGDSPVQDIDTPEVDLYQLQVNTLRRYKRHFKLPTRPGLNKAQLVEIVGCHFRSIPVNEKDTLTYFIYSVKNDKNKSDVKVDSGIH